MDSSEIQKQVERFQAEADEARARFHRLMQGLATGESTADETVLAWHTSRGGPLGRDDEHARS